MPALTKPISPDDESTTPSPGTVPGASVQKDVCVQLMYLKDDPLYKTIKPIQITPNFADREKRTNVRLTPGQEEVLKDVRGMHGKPLGDFSLDQHGFTYVKAPTAFKEWSSQPRIAQAYLPELESLLRREIDGCDEILFYDARIRQEGDEGLRVEGLSYNPFARQVHTDNTDKSIVAKIRQFMEMKADYLLSGRAQVINIWRPIKHPVYDCGLAVADGGKLEVGDVVECDRHRADTGDYWDTMGVVKFREGFEWWYCSEQDEEDVLLFKNYDSFTDVNARTCLHTAFDMPSDSIPANAPTRESIEVRALVFTYPADGPRPTALSLPHPLADSLKQNNLKRLDDELTIIDRPRDDIDEAGEIKDAVLLLRRNEIKRLQRVNEEMFNERTKLLEELSDSRHQLSESQRHLLESEGKLARAKQQLVQVTAERDTYQSQVPHYNTFSHDKKYKQLQKINEDNLKTINGQAQAIEFWKGQANQQGYQAMSRNFQGSVDEAVRLERDKEDGALWAMLNQRDEENKWLKEENRGLKDENGGLKEANQSLTDANNNLKINNHELRTTRKELRMKPTSIPP